MAESTCSVPGCGEPVNVKRLRLCRMHYMRWYRTGDAGMAAKQRQQPPAACTFPNCPNPPPYRRGLCSMHDKRRRKHGDPALGARPPADAVGYLGVHHRLRQLRGDAGEHACQHCKDRAYDWAYDHGDPDERQDPRRGPYSLDPDRYLPLCRSCHKRFDLAHRPVGGASC